MQELRTVREVAKRQARRALGNNPFGEILTVGQAGAVGLDAELLAVPVNTADNQPLMDGSGHFLFMLGFSALDGPDPLA